MKLTQAIIKNLQYNDGIPLLEGAKPKRDARWDDDLPNFGVRVYPSGKKSFIISYRIGKRKRQMTLGNYGELTLDQARKRAKIELAKTLDNIDPLAAKDKARQSDNLKLLCLEYIERHAKPHKKSWEEDQRRINNYIIPLYGQIIPDAINKKDVLSLHNRIGKEKPYEANRVIALLSVIFEFALQSGYVEASFINPAKGIKPFKEIKRDRWLTPEELPLLAEAIDNDQNYYARNAIWLYLLTGARKSELLMAKWEYIDWSRSELRLPDTKAGRVHYIPLSVEAIELLKNLKRIDGNPYILPGHVKGQHLINISKPWIRIRKSATLSLWKEIPDYKSLVEEAEDNYSDDDSYSTSQLFDAVMQIAQKRDIKLPTGLTDIRIHDLRRTLGSWLAQAGNSLHLIGKVLNHSNQSTTAIYARFGQDHVKQALEDHGNRLMVAAGKRKAL